MKALSIRQPWAWLIASGIKDVENRSWPTKFRGRIYIHAGKKMDKAGLDWLVHNYNLQRAWNEGLGRDTYCDIMERDETDYTKGAIIGEVDIVDCQFWYDFMDKGIQSPWGESGKYGFVLHNPVLYQTPIPCKGQLGFFEVTPEAETEYSPTLRTE